MEGEYSYYIFFCWSIFLLFFSNLLDKKNKDTTRGINVIKIFKSKLRLHHKNDYFISVCFISFLLLLTFLVTIFFSHHLPLSFDKYLFYLLSIIIFLFFLQIKKDLSSLSILVEYLLLLTLVLNILVIFLSFFHNYNYLFQGMNLLVRTHGHNHYAAFLLLILPINWWMILKKIPSYFLNYKSSFLINIFLLISSYFLLIISLSRLALFIAIMQFFVIFLLTKKDFQSFRKQKIINSSLKLTIFGFLFVAILFLVLSIPVPYNKQSCPLNFYNKNFCLSFAENSRIYYWRQAWLTFKNYPIFGYGLGTFQHSARLFPTANEKHSSYAHNIFLHNLAEMGIIGGGVFIFFIIMLFYQSYKRIRKYKSTKDAEKFLFIAALSSLINAMFDFDWHFFAIFSLTLIFLALILNNGEQVKKENLQLKQIWHKLLIILSVFATFLVFSDLLIIRNYFNGQKKFEKIVPFFNLAVKSRLEDASITIADYERFYKMYRYDTKFIYIFLNREDLSRDRQQQLYLNLARIDPSRFITLLDFKEFSNCCLDEAEILLREWLRIADKENMLNDQYFFISYEKKIILAKQVSDLAQQAYLQKQWSQASYFYQVSHHLNPYIFSDFRPLFLDEREVDNLVSFFQEFRNFPFKEFPDHYAYLFQYRRATDKLFQENRLIDFEEMIISIINQKTELVEYFIKHLYEQTDDEEKIKCLSEIEERYSN